MSAPREQTEILSCRHNGSLCPRLGTATTIVPTSNLRRVTTVRGAAAT